MKIFVIVISFLLLSCTQIKQNWYLTPDEVERGILRAEKAGYRLYYNGTKEGNYVSKKRIYHTPVPFADQARNTILYNYNWWTFDE